MSPRRVRGVKLEVQSHWDEWRPYRWRDPARCSPDRLAELAAHDRHIARLNVLLKPYRPGKGQV